MNIENLTLKYAQSLNDDELSYVEEGFSKLAFEARGISPLENFCINYYDHEQLVATVFGIIYYGSMYIDTLFVDESYRGQHLGTELMQKAEDLALERSCKFITITTMDWEARDFYEKLGYKFEYERTGYMNGAVLYGLKKDL